MNIHGYKQSLKGIIRMLRKEESRNEISCRIAQGTITDIRRSAGIQENKISEMGTVFIWIDPDKEPGIHIFNDLALLKTGLDSWGGQFIFLYGSDPGGVKLDISEIKGLPENSCSGVDYRLEKLTGILNSGNPPGARLPYVILIDTDGNIRFSSEGYRIGIGEQILRHSDRQGPSS